MKYKPKYKTYQPLKEYKNPAGLRPDPTKWLSGPDEIQHDKYYALLKHRAQARFRKESHSLTWEQWQDLWPHDLWFQRGRTKESLCLMQIDPEAGWHKNNVEVVTRHTYLKRAQEYKK